LHDAGPEFIIDANLPWRAWRNLLAGDEAVGQPAMNAARVHAENLVADVEGSLGCQTTPALRSSSDPRKADVAETESAGIVTLKKAA
jgi:hypothetical protein